MRKRRIIRCPPPSSSDIAPSIIPPSPPPSPKFPYDSPSFPPILSSDWGAEVTRGQEFVTPPVLSSPPSCSVAAQSSLSRSVSLFDPLLPLFPSPFFLLLCWLELFLDAVLIGVSIHLHSHTAPYVSGSLRVSLSRFLLFPSVL